MSESASIHTHKDRDPQTETHRENTFTHRGKKFYTQREHILHTETETRRQRRTETETETHKDRDKYNDTETKSTHKRTVPARRGFRGKVRKKKQGEKKRRGSYIRLKGFHRSKKQGGKEERRGKKKNEGEKRRMKGEKEEKSRGSFIRPEGEKPFRLCRKERSLSVFAKTSLAK